MMSFRGERSHLSRNQSCVESSNLFESATAATVACFWTSLAVFIETISRLTPPKPTHNFLPAVISAPLLLCVVGVVFSAHEIFLLIPLHSPVLHSSNHLNGIQIGQLEILKRELERSSLSRWVNEMKEYIDGKEISRSEITC
jgi:hypothetical protein